jgi:hypothetical protein
LRIAVRAVQDAHELIAMCERMEANREIHPATAEQVRAAIATRVEFFGEIAERLTERAVKA